VRAQTMKRYRRRLPHWDIRRHPCLSLGGFLGPVPSGAKAGLKTRADLSPPSADR